VLLRDRSRPAQIVIGGVTPAVIGSIAGVLIGASGDAMTFDVLAGMTVLVAFGLLAFVRDPKTPAAYRS